MNRSPVKGKILVIRGGAIGDFILTLPAIAALRQQFPDAQLEVLGYPHIAQLALAGSLVDRVQPIEARALAGFFARNGELSEDLRDYFSEFNIVVSYLFDPDEVFQTNVLRCLRGQFIAGPHRPDESQRIHATEVYLKPLERLAIFAADPIPRLTVHAAHHKQRTLALHPGSGSELKNWPNSKWVQLLPQLIESTPLNLLIVGGEAEAQRLDQLAKLVPADRGAIARNLPLPELAGRLQSCRAFVGHDSGITHLAAAVGVPTTVLWPHTNEAIWRPQGDHVKVLRNKNGLQQLTVEAVLDELRRLLPL